MEIKNRKTIRKYKSVDVEETLIHELLTEAMHAPTMGNMQLYSVIETRSAEGKERLAPFHFNQPMVKGCSVMLTFVADFRRFTQWCNASNADAGYDNMLSFANAMTDALLFCQAFCTLAEQRGLGTCFLGTSLYSAQGIIDALNLPKLTFPVATITVGWPDEDPAMQDRLDLSAILHKEQYTQVSDDKVKEIFAYKESLEENKNFVEINGKQNLAQVFTDCRYTREANEAISADILATLKKQGFMK